MVSAMPRASPTSTNPTISGEPLNPGEAQYGYGQRAWQQADAGGQCVAAVLVGAGRAQALEHHHQASNNDERVAQSREARRAAAEHSRQLLQYKPEYEEDGEARQHVQERCRERNPHSLGGVPLATEEIGGQGRLAVTWRQRVQRAECKRQGHGGASAAAQLPGQGVDDLALKLGQVRNQPVRHGTHVR